MMDVAHQPVGRADTALASDGIEWRSRYDGLVMIARVGDKAVAGISGPWSGKFALTWWERPLPARQLELYASMDAAMQEVESWAERMRTGGLPIGVMDATARVNLHIVPTLPPPPRLRSSIFDRVRALLPRFARVRSGRSSRETIERLRRQQACSDTDISDLHFAAIE